MVDPVLEVLIRVGKGLWDLAKFESLLIGELRGKGCLLVAVWRGLLKRHESVLGCGIHLVQI